MVKSTFIITGRTVCFIFFLLTMGLLGSCKKELSGIPAAGNVSAIKRPGISAAGGIIIQNNSASPLRITVNGITKEQFVAPLGMDTLLGDPQSPTKVLVETIVMDAAGNPAGQQLVFFYSMTYPGNRQWLRKEVNIPANLFFLKVRNLAKLPATGVIVSEPGTGNTVSSSMGTLDAENNIACGYYPNTTLVANIKLVNSNNDKQQWDFTGVQLPGIPNQSVVLTCN